MNSHTSLVAQQTRLSEWADDQELSKPSAGNDNR